MIIHHKPCPELSRPLTLEPESLGRHSGLLLSKSGKWGGPCSAPGPLHMLTSCLDASQGFFLGWLLFPV